MDCTAVSKGSSSSPKTQYSSLMPSWALEKSGINVHDTSTEDFHRLVDRQHLCIHDLYSNSTNKCLKAPMAQYSSHMPGQTKRGMQQMGTRQ
eukprot:309998-Amphidinium_carterae.2